MNENIDMQDIILGNDTNSNTKNIKKILTIIAILIVLFLLILVIMKFINSGSKIVDESALITPKETNIQTPAVVITPKQVEKEPEKKPIETKPVQVIAVKPVEIKPAEPIQEKKVEEIKPKEIKPVVEEKLIEIINQPIVKKIEEKPQPKVEKKIVKKVEKIEKKVVKKPNVVSQIKPPKPQNLPIAEKTKVKPKTQIKQQISSKNSKNFIQVLSVSKYDENSKEIKEILAKGYKITAYDAVVNGKKVVKILVGPYANETDLQNNLAKIRKNLAHGAFVYRIK